ncbi:MAG: hypothetical protein K6F00_11250 [Lachnospiraceae bacterium]|nr:hypothetical protein [Lachnospiraceae bacterium]
MENKKKVAIIKYSAKDIEKLPLSYAPITEDAEKSPIDFKVKCTEKEIDNKDFLINYIGNNNIYKVISKSIVRKIASNKADRNNTSCLEMLKANFKHEIFEDIAEDIFICIYELIQEDKCYINKESRLITFDTYITEDGKEKSYYLELYKSVRRTLTMYSNDKQHYLRRKIDGKDTLIPISVVNYDALATTEDGNGNTLEMLVSKASPLYVQSTVYNGDLEDIYNNDDFFTLMKFIKERVTEKKFDIIKKVVVGLLKGMKSETIATTYDISIDKVKKARQDIKAFYSMAKENGLEIELEKHSNKSMFGVKESASISCERIGYSYIGKYCRDKETDKPYYKSVNKSYDFSKYYRKALNNPYKSFYFNSSYAEDTKADFKSKDYTPLFGSLEMADVKEINDKKDFTSNEIEFRYGKRVYTFNKKDETLEVWNYIAEDGYIYSKELLRAYPIYKS